MIKHAIYFLICATVYGLKNGIVRLASNETLLLSQVEGEILIEDLRNFNTAQALILNSSTIDRIESFCEAPLVKIVLANSSLPHLTGSMFSKCTNLQELKITGNPDLTMDADALHNLTRLEKLEIVSQPMEKLTREHLKGLPSLKTLVIEHCDLEAIEAGALDQLRNLKMLRLGHNELRSLEVRGLKHLEEIQVIDNKLEEIPVVEGLDNLKKFKLSNNKIAKMEASKLKNLTRFFILSIGQNPISCKSFWNLSEKLGHRNYKIVVGDCI